MKRHIDGIVYGARVIYAASKKYFALKAMMTAASALLPFAPMILWRNLLNNISIYKLRADDSAISRIAIFTIAYCIVYFISKVLDSVSQYVTYKYNDEISHYLDNVIVDKISSVDLAFFESSQLRDKLQNSWALVNSVQNIVWVVFETATSAIRFAISLDLLSSVNLLLLPLAILFALPSAFADKKVNEYDYRFETEHATTQRKMDYFKDLFFGNAQLEIRLYELKDHFLDIYKNEWRKWDSASKKKNLLQFLIKFAVLRCFSVNELIIYFYAVAQFVANKISIGDVTYYVSVATQFRSDFSRVCALMNTFTFVSKRLDDVRSFLEMSPAVETSGELTPPQNPKIEFRNVSFSYPNSATRILPRCAGNPAGRTFGRA
jgi:ABC-type multidrug transport system fused ATPase/permease subunit